MLTARRVFWAALLWAAFLALFPAAPPAQARDLVYGAWTGPDDPFNAAVLPRHFKTLETRSGGSISWKLVTDGLLAGPFDTLDRVRDGLIDAGLGKAVFYPERLPATAMIYDHPVLGPNVAAASAAVLETTLLDCPACLEEHRRNNAVPLGQFSVSGYVLMCRPDVRGVEGLKGLNVRAMGGFADFVHKAGATPVDLPLDESLAGLENELIDCVLGPPSWIGAFEFGKVAKNLLLQRLGMNGPAMGLMMNRDSWSSLTVNERRLHLDMARHLTADQAVLSLTLGEEAALAEAKEKLRVRLNPPTEPQKWKALLIGHQAAHRDVLIARAEAAGVADAAGIMDALDANIAKWEALTAEAGAARDVGAFAHLLDREIFAHLDGNAF